jgi:hypothetical protein
MIGTVFLPAPAVAEAMPSMIGLRSRSASDQDRLSVRSVARHGRVPPVKEQFDGAPGATTLTR